VLLPLTPIAHIASSDIFDGYSAAKSDQTAMLCSPRKEAARLLTSSPISA